MFSWRNKEKINNFLVEESVLSGAIGVVRYCYNNWATPKDTRFKIRLFFFFYLKILMFFLISPRKHVVGTHKKFLNKALLMSIHNICFRGEIRELLCGYPFLSGAISKVL